MGYMRRQINLLHCACNLGKIGASCTGLGGAVMTEADALRRRRELLVFLFLTVVLAPVLAVAVVGGYGFIIWMYQLFNGPPTG